MATLAEERAQLTKEMAGIDLLTKSDGASVDELERALNRRAALEIRARAVDSRIAAEAKRKAEEEAQRRAQEAARLAAGAGAIIDEAVDLLLKVIPLCEKHSELMQKVNALGGASFNADRRGENLRRVLNANLQDLAPGRFYPIDQHGTLADRKRGG